MYKILMTVDDSIAQKNFHNQLQLKLGKPEIVFAQNTQDALMAFNQHPPVSLAVLDLHSFQVDNLQIVAHLSSSFPDTPCFILGDHTLLGLKEYDPTDLYHYFQKPYDMEKLTSKMALCLRESGPHNTIRGIPISIFMQLISKEAKTCLLGVYPADDDNGLFYFNKGILFDAVCGSLKGEDAATKLLRKGKAEVRFKDIQKKIARHINTSIMAIIEDLDNPAKQPGATTTHEPEETEAHRPKVIEYGEYIPHAKPKDKAETKLSGGGGDQKNQPVTEPAETRQVVADKPETPKPDLTASEAVQDLTTEAEPEETLPKETETSQNIGYPETKAEEARDSEENVADLSFTNDETSSEDPEAEGDILPDIDIFGTLETDQAESGEETPKETEEPPLFENDEQPVSDIFGSDEPEPGPPEPGPEPSSDFTLEEPDQETQTSDEPEESSSDIEVDEVAVPETPAVEENQAEVEVEALEELPIDEATDEGPGPDFTEIEPADEVEEQEETVETGPAKEETEEIKAADKVEKEAPDPKAIWNDHIDELRDVRGYKAAAMLNFAGEVIAFDSVDANIHLDAIGATFNALFWLAQDSFKRIGLETFNELTIRTPAGLVIMASSGSAAKARFHLISILEEDGNQNLMRFKFGSMIPKINDSHIKSPPQGWFV